MKNMTYVSCQNDFRHKRLKYWIPNGIIVGKTGGHVELHRVINGDKNEVGVLFIL